MAQSWTFIPDKFGEYVDHGESFEFKLVNDPGMTLGDEVILEGEDTEVLAQGRIDGLQLDVGPESSRYESSVTVVR